MTEEQREALEWWHELATATKRDYMDWYFPHLRGEKWPRITVEDVEYIFEIETDPDTRKCTW